MRSAGVRRLADYAAFRNVLIRTLSDVDGKALFFENILRFGLRFADNVRYFDGIFTAGYNDRDSVTAFYVGIFSNALTDYVTFGNGIALFVFYGYN